jgi:hypothetical protein
MKIWYRSTLDFAHHPNYARAPVRCLRATMNSANRIGVPPAKTRGLRKIRCERQPSIFHAPYRSVLMCSAGMSQAMTPSAAAFTNGLFPQMKVNSGGAGRRCSTLVTIALSIRRP